MEKRLVLFLILLMSVLSLNAQRDKGKIKVVKDPVSVDSVTYELIVLDPGFETWYITRQLDQHSDDYFRLKNIVYVQEWNNRYMNQSLYRNIYDCYIDYDPQINYGYEFNSRLYYYFKYFEEVNGLKLLPDSR